ncbi:unnamed protein product [Cyclocybe aegerita]|uniref:Fungal-type protein kinase domain-containing protein n=1 Tax=Cyclocybe aegerita TaxID=1973307 RepID=A0A8S0VYH6_CYCAE|nr:unnamed protein product [Cyclocybe aegerita]
MSINYLRTALLNSHSESIRLSQASASLADQFLSGSPAQTPPASPAPKSENPDAPTKDSFETPFKKHCDGPEEGFSNVAVMTPILEAELFGTTQRADEDFFKQVVKTRVKQSDASIGRFVRDSGLYNHETKRWDGLNPETQLEKDLYDPLCNIFEQVVATFKLEQREVIPTFNIQIKHIEDCLADSTLKTSPDLFFYGSDTNFHAENLQLKRKEKANYRYCASPCEVKTEKNLTEGVVTQVAVYARQCFIQQGNRHYVYSLVITEERVFLLQFDRNGVLRTQSFDIHKKPKDFIYLILLVSSPDCATLGFDTNVYWKEDKRYITTLNENGERVEYEIINSKPFFQRRTIRGRGTLCWLVQANGIMRIVKDSWQAKGRDPEHNLLQKVEGLPGVGQMIAFEPENLSIAKLRGMEGQGFPDGMANRLFRRIILQAYGNPIHKFSSRMQLLCAFRDAVAGHQRMWEMNVIHRDISVNNVLIGADGAEEGWKGVVIDLDMAVFWERELTMALVDFRTGTRAFQSLFVLNSEKDRGKKRILAHDYLDDLESFFYVFCWVCMRYDVDANLLKDPPLKEWESENIKLGYLSKKEFLTSEPIEHDHNEVIDTFGPIFQTLFDALRAFLREKYYWKLENRNTMPTTIDAMLPRSKKDYATFINLFDTSIEALKKEEATSSSPPLPPPAPAPAPLFVPSPHSSKQAESSGALKRTRDERDAGAAEMDVDGEQAPPASKRPYTGSMSSSQPGVAPESAMPAAAAVTVPAPRRSSRLRTGSIQSVQANVEAAPAPVARRRSTRSRNGSRSTQPAEAPINNGASSSNGTQSRPRNGSAGSGGRQTTSRAGSGGARNTTRARAQSGGASSESTGVTGLRRGREATRKGGET